MAVCSRGQIFGTPSELVEMFDTAHVLMFLIVVLFVTMTGLILWRFTTFCEDWEGYELTAIEAVKQVRLVVVRIMCEWCAAARAGLWYMSV